MTAIIVLYIILGIIAFAVILLHFSVRAYVRLDDSGFDIRIKYLFFTVYPREKKEKKKKRNKSVKLKKNKTENKKNSDTPLSCEEIEKLQKQLEEQKSGESDKVKSEENLESKENSQESSDAFEDKKSETAGENQRKEKNPEAKNKSKKQQKKLGKQNKAASSDKLSDLKSKWLKLKPYVPTGKKTVKKLLKMIRFENTAVELSIGKEDAYEAATAYGKLNASLYNGLAALGLVFTMHYKKCKVNCIFNEKVFKYDVSTCVHVRPSTLIAVAFCTLMNFLRIFLCERRKAKKTGKQSAKANEIKKYDETEMSENE